MRAMTSGAAASRMLLQKPTDGCIVPQRACVAFRSSGMVSQLSCKPPHLGQQCPASNSVRGPEQPRRTGAPLPDGALQRQTALNVLQRKEGRGGRLYAGGRGECCYTMHRDGSIAASRAAARSRSQLGRPRGGLGGGGGGSTAAASLTSLLTNASTFGTGALTCPPQLQIRRSLLQRRIKAHSSG